MNSKFLISVAAFALATSAFADPVTSGSATGNWGLRTCTNTDDSDCGLGQARGIAGSFQYALGSFSLQADLQIEQYVQVRDAGDNVQSARALGLHAAYRNDQWLGGLFASLAGTDMYGTHIGQVYGAEFQWYSDDATYYGTVGYSDIVFEAGDTRFQGLFEQFEYRYFIGDDTQINAFIAYGESRHGFEDNGDSGNVANYGLSLTRRWEDTSFFYTLGYERGTYNANTEDDGGDERFVLGVTWMFGTASLKQADREGATLRTSLLPSRAASWANALD